MKSEIILGEYGSGGEVVGTQTDFSAQASVSITCDIGDLIVLAVKRSVQSNVLWNGQSWNGIPADEKIGYTQFDTNTFNYYLYAGQTSNTLTISSGTMTGSYLIVKSE